MATIKALDVSSHSGPISVFKWRAAFEDGWQLAIVQAWGGLPGGGSGPNPHCSQQLATARVSGLLTAIYIVIPPDTDPHTHLLILRAKEAAGDEYQHVRAVAMDIEDEDRRPLHPTDPDARLMDAIDNVPDKPVWIYTSLGMWPPMMGDSCTFPDYPLWDARWSPPEGLDGGFVPYGGWSECAMRQYQGTTLIHGISADLNVADLARLGLEVDPCAALRAERDALLGQLEQARMLGRSAASTLQTIVNSLRYWAGT